MTIDRKLLEMLVCPISKQPVVLLNAAQLQRINELIAQGALHTIGGDAVTEPLRQAVITQNFTTIYRIDDDIPVMIEACGIACEQIGEW